MVGRKELRQGDTMFDGAAQPKNSPVFFPCVGEHNGIFFHPVKPTRYVIYFKKTQFWELCQVWSTSALVTRLSKSTGYPYRGTRPSLQGGVSCAGMCNTAGIGVLPVAPKCLRFLSLGELCASRKPPTLDKNKKKGAKSDTQIGRRSSATTVEVAMLEVATVEVAMIEGAMVDITSVEGAMVDVTMVEFAMVEVAMVEVAMVEGAMV